MCIRMNPEYDANKQCERCERKYRLKTLINEQGVCIICMVEEINRRPREYKKEGFKKWINGGNPWA